MCWAMEHAGKINEFRVAAQLLCLLVPFHKQCVVSVMRSDRAAINNMRICCRAMGYGASRLV